MPTLCPTCHQPLPDQPRRDPPLPPLDAPAVVKIHDLPAEERARVEVTPGSANRSSSYRLPGRKVGR